MLSRNVAGLSDNVVTTCGLDSMSIFFRNRVAGADAGLRYLYHHGVSEEAQETYLKGRVFENDPFTSGANDNDRCGRLIRWGDNDLSNLAARAVDYRSFIDCHGVDVVGAWVQQVLPDFLLVIGVHCRPGGKRRANVPMARLEAGLGRLSQQVIGDLFERVLSEAGGLAAVDAVLGPGPRDEPMPALSPRELDIARLVSSGKQNKQIAFAVGISEFTVENHLRHIFRKLGVHNRTAMTARLFSRPVLQ